MEGSSKTSPGLSHTQQMMFAFGDFRRPNPESAKLVEQVVLAQLRTIIHLAADIAHQRNTKILIIEDILFLMRKSPLKIQRLIKYLKSKDKSAELTLMEKGDVLTDKRPNSTQRCRAFLNKIDETGVLLAACDQEYYDDIYYERLTRFDKITKNMDERKYLEFHKARCVSFRGKYSQWFQEALQEVVDNLDIKLEKLTNDVICYLAYETLGQIVELCLLVRRDINALQDPMGVVCVGESVNTSFPNVSLPFREKTDNSKKSDFKGCPITPAEVQEAVRRLQLGERHRTMFNSRKRIRGIEPEPTVPLLAI